ncbi:MAG TPA: SRPBCC family protein [Chitinophagaceae bacterium]|nr:SRPBCC family protein [Chitinophagaceae bacterium]
MHTIHITSVIHAPVERVFNLSRNLDLHKKSMECNKEKAIDGVTGGLINLNESVTWEAKHFFKTRRFTSKITAMKPYESFTDEMQKGDFKSFQHQHHFKTMKNGTIVIDIVKYEIPYGIIGRLLNRFYLHNYLKSLIERKNQFIKEYAESNKWESFLPEEIKIS